MCGVKHLEPKREDNTSIHPSTIRKGELGCQLFSRDLGRKLSGESNSPRLRVQEARRVKLGGRTELSNTNEISGKSTMDEPIPPQIHLGNSLNFIGGCPLWCQPSRKGAHNGAIELAAQRHSLHQFAPPRPHRQTPRGRRNWRPRLTLDSLRQGLTEAEGTRFELATPYGAPHFQLRHSLFHHRPLSSYLVRGCVLRATAKFRDCRPTSAIVRPLGYTLATRTEMRWLAGRHRGLSLSAFCVIRWTRGNSANRFSSPEVTLLETILSFANLVNH